VTPSCRHQRNWSSRTLLKSPAPTLKTYPKKSVVAEKFEAIVKLGIANSRMKDFYDLWILAQRFEFENAMLAAAIQATLESRHTPLPSSFPLAFSADFHQLPNKQTQWKAFLRKSALNANSSLEETLPLYFAHNCEQNFRGHPLLTKFVSRSATRRCDSPLD